MPVEANPRWRVGAASTAGLSGYAPCRQAVTAMRLQSLTPSRLRRYALRLRNPVLHADARYGVLRSFNTASSSWRTRASSSSVLSVLSPA